MIDEFHERILIKITRKVFGKGNGIGLHIPSEIQQQLELKEGSDVILCLERGKHGKFISIWNPEQQAREKENITNDTHPTSAENTQETETREE